MSLCNASAANFKASPFCCTAARTSAGVVTLVRCDGEMEDRRTRNLKRLRRIALKRNLFWIFANSTYSCSNDWKWKTPTIVWMRKNTRCGSRKDLQIRGLIWTEILHLEDINIRVPGYPTIDRVLSTDDCLPGECTVQVLAASAGLRRRLSTWWSLELKIAQTK